MLLKAEHLLEGAGVWVRSVTLYLLDSLKILSEFASIILTAF